MKPIKIKVQKKRTNFVALDHQHKTIEEATTATALVNKLDRKGIGPDKYTICWVPKPGRKYHFLTA